MELNPYQSPQPEPEFNPPPPAPPRETGKSGIPFILAMTGMGGFYGVYLAFALKDLLTFPFSFAIVGGAGVLIGLGVGLTVRVLFGHRFL